MSYGTKQFVARVEELTAANEFVTACADRFGFDETGKFGLLLALEEAFVNICSYAYDEGEGVVELSCAPVGNELMLEIADRGKPFDVLALPAPDTTVPIMERRLGGLGIHFIRTLAASAGYRRENGRNILRLTFKRGGQL